MKPHYRYAEKEDTYIGGTKYIDGWLYWPITLFGVLIAASRLRDPLLRAKFDDMWKVITCRSKKRLSHYEFQELANKNKLHAFLKTSLNTELMLTILKGIIVLAASTSD